MQENVRFRPLAAADLPLADELRRLAGWNQTVRDWAGYLSFEPEGCFAAEKDGRLVGTATTITYGQRLGWIGMVLVHPAARRAGIGTALLHRSIDYLKERGVAVIKLDATPMGREVYLPLGFRDEYGLSRYEGLAGSLPGLTPRSITPLRAADLPEMAAFDAVAFGAPRGAVLAEMATRNPEFCFVSRGAGGIDGFIIAREGSNAIQVGPWIAREPEVAEALLDPLLQAVAGRKIFIDVPAPNPAGVALMARLKLRVQRGFTRMFLGENGYPGNPAQVYSTSGAEKG